MAHNISLTAAPPKVDLHGAFVRRVTLRGARLDDANLAGADATGADFRDADFQNANLNGTILRGADLRGAVNLTQEQLSKAVLDRTTKLPTYIDATQLHSDNGKSVNAF